LTRAVLAGSVWIALIARADADPAPGPIVLAPGQIAAQLVVEAGFDTDHAADPIIIAPDVWWGVAPRWTIGVIHSDASVDQVDVVGASFCVRHSEFRCGRVYRGSGLDARWLAFDHVISIAPRVRALVRDLGPWKPAVTVGALGRWTRGWFSITADPHLRLGLVNQASGNRPAVVVPVWFGAHVACRWDVALHTGWSSDVAVAADGYHVPLTAVIGFAATSHVALGLEAGFASVFGPQNNSGKRDAMLSIAWTR
jgi:hypothetical protein